MSDNNLSKLLDKGLIRVKKRKSPRRKSLSSEKYREFLKSTKRGSTPIQKIMKKNIKNTIKKTDTLIKKSENKPDIIVKKIDNVKKFNVVDNPVQPVFKINRKETIPSQKKTKIKKKKSKKSKRKPRKVSFTVKKTRAKKMNLKIGEIPTVFHRMKFRPSFIKFRSVWEFFINLLWYRLFNRPII